MDGSRSASLSETSQAETLHLKVKFYRRALRRTVGGDVATIYQRELSAAELDWPNWKDVPTRTSRPSARAARSRSATLLGSGAIGHLVMHEVGRPASIRPRRQRHGRPRPDCALAPTAPAHHQPLLPVEPIYPLLVDGVPFAPQQHPKPPITKPAALRGQLLQPLPQLPVIRPPAPITHARPIRRANRHARRSLIAKPVRR